MVLETKRVRVSLAIDADDQYAAAFWGKYNNDRLGYEGWEDQ